MNIKATVLSYEIKPYPKLSHTTVDIVEFYKGKLRLHKNFFKSINCFEKFISLEQLSFNSNKINDRFRNIISCLFNRT